MVKNKLVESLPKKIKLKSNVLDASILDMESSDKKEDNTTVNQMKRKRKPKQYTKKKIVVKDLNQIISNDVNRQRQSKRLKHNNNNYPSIIKNDIKAKLKIKLEPRLKTTNNKLMVFKSLNKFYNKNKTFLRKTKDKFSNENLNQLGGIKKNKVADIFINNKSGIKKKNAKSVRFGNTAKKKLLNINVIKKSMLLSKHNKKVKNEIKSRVKQNPKKKIKQSVIKDVKNISVVNKYNINENDDIICRICKQKLDNQLKFYSGEPQNGYEEELANIDFRLLQIHNGVQNISKDNTKVYNKLTYFSIYCKNGHLCPFDSELLENNKEIYFSGYVKSIQSDDPSIEDGIPGKNFGPIAHWWVKSFKDEEQPIIIVSTEIGDYTLMKPSDEYASFMKTIITKLIISKIVIEYLIYEPNAIYEDLLSKIQNKAISENSLSTFTENKLMCYAPFICDQVTMFDETSKPWEQLLVVTPCIRRLLDLTGITILDNLQNQQQSYWKDTKEIYREKLMQKVLEDSKNHSVSEKLIDRLLFFHENIFTTAKNRSWSKCKICKQRQRPACKACTACSEKKFNLCLQRRCLHREIQKANEEDAKDIANLSPLEAEYSINIYKNNIKKFLCFESKLSWLGKPSTEESGNVYFDSIKLDDEVIGIDDFVFVSSVDSSVPPQIVKVAYMWQDEVGVARFHANYFWSQKDTVLENFVDPRELFFINRCCNMAMSCVLKKAPVVDRCLPKYLDESEISQPSEAELENSFFYQKCYNPITGCFRDLEFYSEISQMKVKSPHKFCYNCELARLRNERNTPRPLEKLKDDDAIITYGAIMYKEEEYRLGSCVYLRPKSLYYKYPMLDNNEKLYANVIKMDNEERYPEYYRKFEDPEKNSKLHIPSPFDIGYITEIFTIKEKLFIKVKKLYRPENTHRGKLLNHYDINMLFWSNEECTVAFNYVVRKCYLIHATNVTMNLYEWLNLGPDRFYFTQIYNDNQFYNIDENLYSSTNETLENPKNYPNVKKLKTLDLFAGYGGLSLGLSQTGVAKICWAIENNALAAKTYKLNNPDTIVFVEDANAILTSITKGETCLNDQCLPSQRDVELLCATIPLKNFKNLNNISAFKNSPIATFISYCEYYKPSLFVLEADEELIKRSIVLKLTLACFVGMGYQVSFDLLQIGCYGAPQNRKRSVILGAASGQILPKYPKSLHVFPKIYCQSEIVVDNTKYVRGNNCTDSAPYKVVTIRDAISDLPNIKAGDVTLSVNYNGKPAYYFQKMMRLNVNEPILLDHICKDLGPVVQARIVRIPTSPGSDWRNLPNIEIELEDGMLLKKLVYENNEGKSSKGSHSIFKGSCICSIDKKCHLVKNRQESTLIPWYLAHSATQNANWPGLYGRLQWDGFFAGTTTNPEPLGEQGPCIHPTQPRVVSVRECARFQGFPDNYIFPEDTSIRDKYRQIGCATSPFLALAIGREIARSLGSKER